MSLFEQNLVIENKSIRIPLGLEVFYTEVNPQQAKCLLFIHGLGSFGGAWQELIHKLSPNYRCIAIDLPGFGKSAIGDFTADIPFFVKVLHQFIHVLEIEDDLYLMGHSMGGHISLAYALEAQAKLKGMVLLASAGIETFLVTEAQQIKDMFDLETYLNLSALSIRYLMELNFYHPQLAFVQMLIEERLSQLGTASYPQRIRTISQAVVGMLDYPVFEQLTQIKIPCLIIYGANDQLIPNQKLHPHLNTAAIAQSAATQLPFSTSHVLAECGHFPHVDQLEHVSELIDGFIK